MALYKEEERFCREVGSTEGLSLMLAVQADLLRTIPGRNIGAMHLVEEALEIATRHGYQQLIPQIESTRAAIVAEGVGSQPAAYKSTGNQQASMIQSQGDYSTPHSSPDGARAAQLHVEYQKALKKWQALPWLKRIRNPKAHSRRRHLRRFPRLVETRMSTKGQSNATGLFRKRLRRPIAT